MFSEFLNLMVWALPHLVISLLGLIISIIWRKRAGRPASILSLAFSLFIIQTLGSLFFRAWLNHSHTLQTSSDKIATAQYLSRCFMALGGIDLLAYALVVYSIHALFRQIPSGRITNDLPVSPSSPTTVL